MPKVPSMEEIVSSIYDGVKNAWDNHYRFSLRKYWLWAAPECYITSHIFDALGELFKDFGHSLILEESIANVLENSNGIYPGKYPSELKPEYRSDIAIYWNNETIRGIIEVKLLRSRSHDLKGISKDVRRICEFLKLKDKVEKSENRRFTGQFGILVVYTDEHDNRKSAREKVENRLSKVESLVSDKVNKNGLSFKKVRGIFEVPEVRSAWGVTIFLIKH